MSTIEAEPPPPCNAMLLDQLRSCLDLLARGTFRLKQRYENNNGLTMLEAVGIIPPTNG